MSSTMSSPPSSSKQRESFRAHGRRGIHLRAVVREEQGVWQTDATILNVSLGGAGIATSRDIAVGTDVLVSFTTPSSWEPISVPGRVRWALPATDAAPPRAGIAFLVREPDQVSALVEVVAKAHDTE